MERFNVIKDICVKLGLTQINNSWIETLGAHLNIPQIPGNDNYEQTVFVEAISNSEVIVPPSAPFISREDGVDFETDTTGYNFYGAGVGLSSNIGENVVNVEIIGGVSLTQDEGVEFQPNTIAYNFTGPGVNLSGGASVGYVNVNIPGAVGPTNILKGLILQNPSQNAGNMRWISKKKGTNTTGPNINTFQETLPTFTRLGVGNYRMTFTGTPFAGYDDDRLLVFLQLQDESKMRLLTWSVSGSNSIIIYVNKPTGVVGVDTSGEGDNFLMTPADSLGSVLGITIEWY